MTDLGLPSFRFEDPWLLVLLAVVLAGLSLSMIRGRRPAGGLLFPSLGLLPATRPGWRIRLRWVLVALRGAALVMFVVALARPQIVRASVESVSEGIDVVLAIDVSGSMSEAGFAGSTKIDAVKRVVHDFLGGLKNDRVGIVIFSGEAVVLGPPTLDYAASQKLVAPIDASNMAKLLDVKVYTIGAVTVAANPDKDVATDSVDEQLMRKIAEQTGGHYYSVTDENSLAEVYREIESLEKSRVGARDFTDYQEAHLGFLALGAALLFVEVALAATLFRRTP